MRIELKRNSVKRIKEDGVLKEITGKFLVYEGDELKLISTIGFSGADLNKTLSELKAEAIQIVTDQYNSMNVAVELDVQPVIEITEVSI